MLYFAIGAIHIEHTESCLNIDPRVLRQNPRCIAMQGCCNSMRVSVIVRTELLSDSQQIPVGYPMIHFSDVTNFLNTPKKIFIIEFIHCVWLSDYSYLCRGLVWGFELVPRVLAHKGGVQLSCMSFHQSQQIRWFCCPGEAFLKHQSLPQSMECLQKSGVHNNYMLFSVCSLEVVSQCKLMQMDELDLTL